MTSDSAVRRLVEGDLGDPHHLLGFHEGVVRAWRPGATAMRMVTDDGNALAMERTDPAGLFEAMLAEPGEGTPAYRLEAKYEDGTTYSYEDPYRFWPSHGPAPLR